MSTPEKLHTMPHEEAICEKLDACLLTGQEIRMGSEGWQSLQDPFPDWEQAAA